MRLTWWAAIRDWLSAHTDALVVAVVVVIGQQEVWTPGWPLANVVGPRWVNSLAYLLCAAALWWRRRAPLRMILFLAAIPTVLFLAVGASEGLGVYLPWLIGLYSLGRYAEPKAILLGGPAILVGYVVHEFRDPAFSFGGSTVAFWWIMGAAWPVGLAFRRREQRTRQLHALATELQRERAQRDQAAAAQERARIAREMHDEVGHGLSVIVLQTVAALGQLDQLDTAGASNRLRTIESTARQALAELRRVMGLLGEEGAVPLPAIPDLRRLPGLAVQVRAAGVPIDLHVEADPGSLPPGLGETAYRIIQEALTNVIKHAGPCRAWVTVTQTTEWLDILITDDGKGGTSAAGGHGLVGMRERVSLYHGQLTAGPGETAGFSVHARFPVVVGAVP
jgi:signal transduction histidine kinase